MFAIYVQDERRWQEGPKRGWLARSEHGSFIAAWTDSAERFASLAEATQTIELSGFENDTSAKPGYVTAYVVELPY